MAAAHVATMGVVRLAGRAPRAVHVYAYATQHAVESHNLLASAARADLPLAIVGTAHVWTDWVTRMRHYVALCAAHAPDDLLVLLDAFDVVVTAASTSQTDEALAAAFRAFGRPIVVSGDVTCCEAINCVPLNAAWWAANPPRSRTREPTPYKYVNAGTVMGRAGALARMYGWMLQQQFKDDQRGLGAFMNAHPRDVALDTERVLFWAHTFRSEVPPATPPFFTHFAGPRADTKALLREAYARHGGPLAITRSATSGHAAVQDMLTRVGVGVVAVLLVAVVVLGGLLVRERRRSRQPPPRPARSPTRAAASPPPTPPRPPQEGRRRLTADRRIAASSGRDP